MSEGPNRQRRKMMPTRNNRLWLPQNAGVQATFCLCEKCGESYEADRKHVCRKKNSYPVKEDSKCD